MSKHTPGPWRASVDISVKAGRFNVCPHVTAGGSSKGMIDEREVSMANARLIAAAPELLDALEWLIALMPDPHLDPDQVQAEYVRKAIEVVAKATGAAPSTPSKKVGA